MTLALFQKKLIILALIFLAGAAFISASIFGIKTIPLSSLFSSSLANNMDSHIFWTIRIPRALLAFLAGAALALSGMTFQALFRNPLATPFTLGVSSGASLGAALYIYVGVGFSYLGISGLSVAAFGGALVSIFLVYALARTSKNFSSATMLLAGVAISLFFSSLILFISYISDFTNSFRILRWLMGGLEVVGYDPIKHILPYVLIGGAIIVTYANELNLLTVGEEVALSRGVDVRRTKKVLFFATSLMVGGVVSECGPIGFVGLMAPHMCRMIIGAEHRYLMPATLLFGGAFLTFCDTLSRTFIPPTEIPIGIITALLGGPFFLWLLLKRGGKDGFY